MGFIVLIILALFMARLFYVVGKSKENSKKKSDLNRDIYRHAYNLGLSYDDLNEFEINPLAKERLKEKVIISRSLSNAKGKTEAMQIAEAAFAVTKELKNTSLFDKCEKDLPNEAPRVILIGDLKIDEKRAKITYNRLVSAVFSATTGQIKYKGSYIFLMNGVNRIKSSQKPTDDFDKIREIDEIEYTDGLRIEKESTIDNVSDFVEGTAVPVIRELYGDDKASQFPNDVLKLYISMSINIREKVAQKAILKYIESDDIDMLMRWLKPFDYMVDHMPSIRNYLSDKEITIEESADPALGFYNFIRH